MCANVSSESVYMFCVYLNQIINKNLFNTNAAVVFMMSLKIKNIFTQILFIGNLIKFI